MDPKTSPITFDVPTSPYLHERLHAYRASLHFYALARDIRAGLPRGLGPLNDQLARASQSICLNVAEGAASRSRDMKRRHFAIAAASAGECAAALDLIAVEDGGTADVIERARLALRQTTVLILGLLR